MVLYTPASPWSFEGDGSPVDLVRDMTKVLFEKQGVGLAAPQIGISKQVFIMGNSDKLIACINPYLLSQSKEEVIELEGCLSFPDLWLRVKRSKFIHAFYYDVEGKTVEMEFDGLMARVFQHELDHLSGICFTSRVSKLALDQAKRKQKKAQRS